jgi:alkylhydroperoxidase family enzyme
MSDAVARQRRLVIDRALNGPGRTSPGLRRAAFDNHGVDERARALIDKTARRAWTVTSADVATVTAAGMSDDEVFELVVSAALGQATRQLQAALEALDEVAGSTRGVEGGGE